MEVRQLALLLEAELLLVPLQAEERAVPVQLLVEHAVAPRRRFGHRSCVAWLQRQYAWRRGE